MRFLRRFSRTFVAFLPRLRSSQAASVSPGELLARFIFFQGYFNANTGHIRHNAFMPTADGDLSVFRTAKLAPTQIWGLADQYIVPALGKPVLARADFTARDAFDRGLDVDADDNPALHANVVSWPTEKSKRKSIAQELAAEAKLEIP